MALLAALVAAGCGTAPPPEGRDALLAADRGAGASLAGVLAEDGYLLAPGLPIVEGREAILRELGDSAGPVERRPLAAMLSADGTHGYTLGRTLARLGDSTIHGKYLAYWRREGAGWRLWAIVANPSPAAPDSVPVPPSGRRAPPSGAGKGAGVGELREADTAFSSRAQASGVGPAFREFAEPGAVLLGGGGSGMVWGDSAIGAWIGGVIPSGDRLSWAPRIAHLAPSGDLGFTIGDAVYIGRERAFTKYLTVWRRQPDGGWRYAADGGNDQPAPEARADLRIRPTPGGLRLTNPDTADVYYISFEHRTTALVNWRPCVARPDCRRVPAGAEVLLPADSIPGWDPSADSVTVFWWRQSAAGAFDSVRTRTIRAR